MAMVMVRNINSLPPARSLQLHSLTASLFIQFLLSVTTAPSSEYTSSHEFLNTAWVYFGVGSRAAGGREDAREDSVEGRTLHHSEEPVDWEALTRSSNWVRSDQALPSSYNAVFW
ncbi:hypothetical protein E2C01_033707 [Portunus trituberculatus]|uniref:Uncharacterized protein n=1 Tax=Portunus trituberculatus TaxID=210409 RepID=A0A5B7F0U0_PORTR|nr:hypothetical protein [Portunus trituberculatus]